MIAHNTKYFLYIFAFTFGILTFGTVDAKTFYIVTIYGEDEDDSGNLLMKKDCERIVDLFKSGGMPGGYQIKESYLRLSKYKQQELINTIGAITRNVSSYDAVLIYVAAHGSYYRQEDGETEHYWHPWGASGPYHGQTKIRELLVDSICQAKLKLFISDTCTTRDNQRPSDDEIGQYVEEFDESLYIRGKNGSNIKIPNITFIENRTRLRYNLDWLMDAEGSYFLSSSIWGMAAIDAVFTSMLYKTLNEEEYYKKTAESKSNRFNVFFDSLNDEFNKNIDFPQKIFWESMGPYYVREMYRNSEGKYVNYDHTRGVVVTWVQTSHPYCPARRADLHKGDYVVGYILSDSQYTGGTGPHDASLAVERAAYPGLGSRWTYMNCNADTYKLSKEMQNQKFIHLLVMNQKEDKNIILDNGEYFHYYQPRIVPNIDLEIIRSKNAAWHNDLKFGMAAKGFNEFRK